MWETKSCQNTVLGTCALPTGWGMVRALPQSQPHPHHLRRQPHPQHATRRPPFQAGNPEGCAAFLQFFIIFLLLLFVFSCCRQVTGGRAGWPPEGRPSRGPVAPCRSPRDEHQEPPRGRGSGVQGGIWGGKAAPCPGRLLLQGVGKPILVVSGRGDSSRRLSSRRGLVVPGGARAEGRGRAGSPASALCKHRRPYLRGRRRVVPQLLLVPAWVGSWCSASLRPRDR